jgi:hypothetical protein
MRVKILLLASLALSTGACSGNVNHGPPPLDKQLLGGKWKNSSEAQVISGYEFADDGTAKVNVRGMALPISAQYAWTAERTLDLEYQATEDVQLAYEVAAKAYKDDVKSRIQAGKVPDRAGPSMLGAVRDKWPTHDTYQVGLSDKPRLLILSSENGASQTFERLD